MQETLARAKVNLTLHITGQRSDGYHLLDSLVVFPEYGDRLQVEAANGLSLTIDGPFGAGLSSGGDNLILRVAEHMHPRGSTAGAAFRLTKNLPIASGIGGGSSDAAAAARLLSRLWGVPVPDLVALGADIPVCVLSQPVRMQGIGDHLSPVPKVPPFWIVLVNSGRPVETAAVFRALPSRDNPPMQDIPPLDSAASFAQWLAAQRNDMEAAAIAIEPSIAATLSTISRTSACHLARMSGSGGTCFGIYADQAAALNAQTSIQATNPDWWCVAAPVL